MKKIPFAVDRNNKANLSTQLSDGFRHAILTGYYRPGDRLPSFSDIAMELGVSIRAPREAIKRLISENLVRSRPRVGCEVIASGERVWKGSVVCTFVAELEGSYYFPMMIGALRRKMIASGYSVITVAVDAGSDGKPDFSQLDALCRVGRSSRVGPLRRVVSRRRRDRHHVEPRVRAGLAEFACVHRVRSGG